MVVVEDGAGGDEVELVLGFGRPRDVGQPLDVGADQVPIGGVLGKCGQPLELTVGLSHGRFRESGGLDLLAELFHLAKARVPLAEFVLDVAQTSAQQAFAADRVDLILTARRERPLGLGDRHLALEVLGDARQPPRGLRLLDQGHALLGRERQGRGDEVGEQARGGDPLDEVLPLVGIVVVEVDHPVRQSDDALPGRIEFGRVGLVLVERIDRHQMLHLSRLGRKNPGARHAHDDGLLALAFRVDHPHHPHDAAHRVELADGGILGGRVALGGDDEEALVAGRLERGQGFRASDRQGHRHAGIQHHVANGE
jgi:hypothetical protein